MRDEVAHRPSERSERSSFVHRKEAQAALEMVVALIGTLALLVGAVLIWSWVNASFVGRQVHYQTTRVVAGSSQPGKCNPYVQPALDLFGTGETVNVVPCQ